MSVNKYTTEALLANARLRAFVPTDTQSWPDASVLSIFNDELTDWLAPFILEAREGHFQTPTYYTIVPGVNTVPIPSDALGSMVYNLVLCDSGNNPRGNVLASKALEDLTGMYTTVGTPQAYAFQGDNILLWPIPDGTFPVLQINYPKRPAQLVASAECAVLPALSIGATTATFTTPQATNTFTTGSTYHIVQNVAPFDSIVHGLSVTAVSATAVTFSAPLTAAIPAGAYFCVSQTAPVLTGVPADMWSFLAQRVACKMLEAKGDEAALQRALTGLKEAQDRALEFMGKRDQGGHKKVVAMRGRFGAYPWRNYWYK